MPMCCAFVMSSQRRFPNFEMELYFFQEVFILFFYCCRSGPVVFWSSMEKPIEGAC